ncbi:MAG TPA: hypothetical protein VLT88_14210 [Desulfosarcina sp.]|nr:hypothetical protein [Desulfosarcina sp.]
MQSLIGAAGLYTKEKDVIMNSIEEGINAAGTAQRPIPRPMLGIARSQWRRLDSRIITMPIKPE